MSHHYLLGVSSSLLFQIHFMSSREKPTLGGTRIKTRKRNIAVPLDPSSFADAIIQIYTEHQGNLDLVAKDVEASELDFSRYGETFFEVVFTGGRMQPGTAKPEEGSELQPWNVLNCPGSKESIFPHVSFIQKILRRRPFMIKSLENVMRRSIQSLELYGVEDRRNLAVLTALCFSQRFTGLSPDFMFSALLNDTLVAKGSALFFLTEFFKIFLKETSLDDAVGLLKRGKVDERLMEFFPPAKQTPEVFAQHFGSEGLSALVDYHKKVVFDKRLKEMVSQLEEMLEESAEVSDVIEMVKSRKKDAGLPDAEILKMLWDTIMGSVQWSGKNQQQNANSALRQLRSWGPLLGAFATTARLEMELLYRIQMQCYEDAKVQKLFAEFVRTLYDGDVLAEDTILLWFRKGTNPKGRQLFLGLLEPFVKWLEEAEEED